MWGLETLSDAWGPHVDAGRGLLGVAWDSSSIRLTAPFLPAQQVQVAAVTATGPAADRHRSSVAHRRRGQCLLGVAGLDLAEALDGRMVSDQRP